MGVIYTATGNLREEDFERARQIVGEGSNLARRTLQTYQERQEEGRLELEKAPNNWYEIPLGILSLRVLSTEDAATRKREYEILSEQSFISEEGNRYENSLLWVKEEDTDLRVEAVLEAEGSDHSTETAYKAEKEGDLVKVQVYSPRRKSQIKMRGDFAATYHELATQVVSDFKLHLFQQ